MSRNDYAKLSPRGDQRYRKNQHPHAPKSGYFVLLLLVIIGITGYYVFSRGILFSKNHEEVNQQPAKTPEAPPKPAKPRFEFYTLLSKETVPVSRNNNGENNSATVTADATTTPEEAAALKAAQEKEKEKKAAEAFKVNDTAALETAPTGVPSLPLQTRRKVTISSTTETATQQPPVTVQQKTTTMQQPKPATVPVPPVTQTQPSTINSNRYLLQVAALQRISDVDQLKAKLTFLGFNVSVEPFQKFGTIWYRIKVGPYLSQEAMQKARQVLTNNRLSSIVITLPPAK